MKFPQLTGPVAFAGAGPVRCGQVPFGPCSKKPRCGKVPFGVNGRPGPGTGTGGDQFWFFHDNTSVTMDESETEEDGSVGGSSEEEHSEEDDTCGRVLMTRNLPVGRTK
jgi:hypothetical protein